MGDNNIFGKTLEQLLNLTNAASGANQQQGDNQTPKSNTSTTANSIAMLGGAVKGAGEGVYTDAITGGRKFSILQGAGGAISGASTAALAAQRVQLENERLGMENQQMQAELVAKKAEASRRQEQMLLDRDALAQSAIQATKKTGIIQNVPQGGNNFTGARDAQGNMIQTDQEKWRGFNAQHVGQTMAEAGLEKEVQADEKGGTFKMQIDPMGRPVYDNIDSPIQMNQYIKAATYDLATGGGNVNAQQLQQMKLYGATLYARQAQVAQGTESAIRQYYSSPEQNGNTEGLREALRLNGITSYVSPSLGEAMGKIYYAASPGGPGMGGAVAAIQELARGFGEKANNFVTMGGQQMAQKARVQAQQKKQQSGSFTGNFKTR